ncbi:espin-like protein, partial [Clarias magur]
CCQILLSHGVSSSERDVDGFTAADLAEYNGHYECARYLRSVMTDPRGAIQLLKESDPLEEELRKRSLVSRKPSSGDYYRHISEIQRDMDSLKNKMVVLPTEEANLSDIDYLVPTLDEKGKPIAEWKRQVMVRQLQARLLNDEAQRRR